jgi:hypothetical protein
VPVTTRRGPGPVRGYTCQPASVPLVITPPCARPAVVPQIAAIVTVRAHRQNASHVGASVKGPTSAVG